MPLFIIGTSSIEEPNLFAVIASILIPKLLRLIARGR